MWSSCGGQLLRDEHEGWGQEISVVKKRASVFFRSHKVLTNDPYWLETVVHSFALKASLPPLQLPLATILSRHRLCFTNTAGYDTVVRCTFKNNSLITLSYIKSLHFVDSRLIKSFKLRLNSLKFIKKAVTITKSLNWV